MQRCKDRCILFYEPPSTRTVRWVVWKAHSIS